MLARALAAALGRAALAPVCLCSIDSGQLLENPSFPLKDLSPSWVEGGVHSRVPVVSCVRGIKHGENDAINPNFVNRNPRNMEMLRLARKPEGWNLEASSCIYWYK
ncbi:39S ribosomal protein L18, mitochondrial [Portunus trituberculatus]|uniref:39S ribosomal protein L18, mitochondrial n=1 Tax=Portunus trituberculatus TaxID=210409 RepID=A0A5B7G9K3_PORTR|nr:39S ribosomal protein L18, mitochondrial [Portunus trituberculatus]